MSSKVFALHEYHDTNFLAWIKLTSSIRFKHYLFYVWNLHKTCEDVINRKIQTSENNLDGWINQYIFDSFLKFYVVTSHHFVEPLTLSVFGLRLTLFQSQGGSITTCALLPFAYNGSSESTLIPQAKDWSQIYTLECWGYCWCDRPMSLLGLLADSSPGPRGPMPDALPTELSRDSIFEIHGNEM